ncbi:hypothetical protein SASPL_148974 [Salvia splendens]|uniref:Early nodulin 93 ENOD93 protein n=1 Tax=Salvia splendens TaxID=180675 RepID=A0A8X8WAX1_SALSN|nr:uncharacterized protein LOC121778447 [Salvia splendens]KAG6391221.1 hypothetical protein SASPL_148974 [Salvia splendens]
MNRKFLITKSQLVSVRYNLTGDGRPTIEPPRRQRLQNGVSSFHFRIERERQSRGRGFRIKDWGKMGIPSESRDLYASRKSSLLIQSPQVQDDAKMLRSKMCTQEGVRAGTKAAAIACVASAIPTLIVSRKVPWAKANINHTGQALIISAASIAACIFHHGRQDYLGMRKEKYTLQTIIRENGVGAVLV